MDPRDLELIATLLNFSDLIWRHLISCCSSRQWKTRHMGELFLLFLSLGSPSQPIPVEALLSSFQLFLGLSGLTNHRNLLCSQYFCLCCPNPLLIAQTTLKSKGFAMVCPVLLVIKQIVSSFRNLLQ